jgi:hypothetical protein
MARLKSHGDEIYRLARHARLINDENYTEERVYAAIMSDGALLFCRHMKCHPTKRHPEGHWRNLGWRYSLNGRKPRKVPEAEQSFIYTPDMMREGLEQKHFTLVRANGKAVEPQAPKKSRVAA